MDLDARVSPDAWLVRILRRPKALLITASAVTFAGIWSASALPIEWVPRVELPSVTLSANWPGAAPRNLEWRVTSLLEEALQGVAGTVHIHSRSVEGQAFLRLEVSRHHNLGLYAAEVADRLAALRPSLPTGVVPRLDYEVPEELQEQQGFMTLELVGDIGGLELRRLADERLAPRLRSLMGIAGVNTEGGEEREVFVGFEEDRLRAYRMTTHDLRRTLSEALSERSLGWLEGAGRRTLLTVPALALPSDLSRLPVASDPDSGRWIRLAELTRTELKAAPTRSLRRIDGHPAVTVSLDRSPGSDLLRNAAQVRQSIAGLKHDLPPGIEVRVAEDRSENVRDELSALATRGALGLAGIVTVLLLFLRHPRAAFAVLASATVAIAAALGFMRPLGLTLNIFTLAGLVLLVGLLVDNATMVVERLMAERQRKSIRQNHHLDTARQALASIWLPLVGCTATTAVVLLPMVYLSGELRTLFQPLAAMTAITLVFSLLSTTILVPVLMPGAVGPRRRFRRTSRWLLTPYATASRYPRTTFVLLLLTLGLPMPLLPELIDEPPSGWANEHQKQIAARYNVSLGSTPVRHARRGLDPLFGGVTRPFLDEVELGRSWDFEEQPELIAWLRLPSGSGLQQADRLIQRFEELALRSVAVERTLVRVVDDLGLLRVLFPRQALELSEPYQLREAFIAQALQLAGVEVGISGLVSNSFYSGLGQVTGIPLIAYGASWGVLDKVTQQFADQLEKDPRVAEVDLHAMRQASSASREAILLGWDSEANIRSGTATYGLADLLRPRLENPAPSLLAHFDGEGRLPVRLASEDAERGDLDRLLARSLPTRDGRPLRLADLATVHLEKEPPAIEREDQQYRRNLRVLYRGPRHMGLDLINRELTAFRPPLGYRIQQPSYSLFDDQAQNDFLWLCLGCLGLVFLVIAGVLESWRLAFWVLLSTPLAWVGIAAGFVFSGENFAEGAFFGVILTIGIAANASILLAARFRQLSRLRPHTLSSRLALLALRQRLRPMWATTFTTLVGMLPLLVVPETGTFWVGFAIAVTGGVTSATLLAPVATMVLAGWPTARS